MKKITVVIPTGDIPIDVDSERSSGRHIIHAPEAQQFPLKQLQICKEILKTARTTEVVVITYSDFILNELLLQVREELIDQAQDFSQLNSEDFGNIFELFEEVNGTYTKLEVGFFDGVEDCPFQRAVAQHTDDLFRQANILRELRRIRQDRKLFLAAKESRTKEELEELKNLSTKNFEDDIDTNQPFALIEFQRMVLRAANGKTTLSENQRELVYKQFVEYLENKEKKCQDS